MILAIDFDGVIHDPTRKQKGSKMGVPMPGAVLALAKLNDAGHTIIIHTIHATTYQQRQAVRNWLLWFETRCDDITSIKPGADFYIDNKALEFVDWERTLQRIDE